MPLLLLDDANVLNRLVFENALEAKACQIDGLVLALRDNLGDGATDGGRVLQAVAARAVGEHKPGQVRMAADD